MEERHLRGDRRVRRILGGLAGVFLLVCLALAALTARETENRMRGDLLQQVLWLAAAVDPDQVKELHFSPADRHNPVFQRFPRLPDHPRHRAERRSCGNERE